MNRVEIVTNGPVMENLCQVTVSDDYANETFHLDNAEVEEARKNGQSDLVGLIAENAGDGNDILRAALTNGSPVTLDGDDLSLDTLRLAMGGEAPKP